IGFEVYVQGNRRPNDRILWDQVLERTMPEKSVFGYSDDDAHNDDQLFRNYNFMLMEELTIEELKATMRRGSSYFCYEPEGSGEGKAPRISSLVVDEDSKTITIEADGLVHWIYGTDKTSEAASSRRSTVVAIGNTFSYAGYQGSYVRAFIKNAHGETCTQPISFIDENADVTVSIDYQKLSLFLFPNPVIDQVSVFMNESAQEDEIRVFDTNGKLVMTKEVEGPLTILPVQNLVSGVYIVKVGERVEKFVK
ncbi:MAG: T9SS type A sorting domain-containing protein, partial [Alphaproteobacteria bacterium]|nr:T9SS type A sorting domain-containing protein [Alphaproteobacteria bacterium]